MSAYSVKGKGKRKWRYDFILEGRRYSEAGFKTKAEAKKAEAEKRKEVEQNRNAPKTEQTPTDMGFLELVNRRLDYVKAYRSAKHYTDCRIMARRWIQHWGQLPCRRISQEMIQWFVLKRSRVSNQTANKEIRYLRSAFNFGRKRKWITVNPTEGIELLPIEKKRKYIPSEEDIEKVLAVADRDTRDYLVTIRDSLARMGEVNRLTWDDVDLNSKAVTLYTRKKKGGHLTPRTVPMTERLFEVLSRRFRRRDPSKPWVFWHTYWTREGKKKVGPYLERTKIMKTLCRKAGVRYFRFHPLRHSGASIMDQANVPIGAIQRILGHESRTTTEIYLHSVGQSEREAMRIFELCRKKSHTNSHTAKCQEGKPRLVESV